MVVGVVIILNSLVIIHSLVLICKDYKLYFRSLFFDTLKDKNYFKKKIIQQVEKEKKAKFRWMTIRHAIHTLNVHKRNGLKLDN